MVASPPTSEPLPATPASAAPPAPPSQEVKINITPETPLEATPSAPAPTVAGASPVPAASGSNADAKHESTGTGAAGTSSSSNSIKEKLALSMTAAATGTASPSGATATAKTAAAANTENQKHEPEQPRQSTTAPHDDGTNDVNPLDFQGTVDSNNDLPSAETLRKIENYMVLDQDGRSHTFRSLYAGSHTARRVLVIFVRHFFCGQCQEYLRQVSASITPEALLRLPVSTFITVVGCGDPGLISMYAEATGCPFPIYADPKRKLYDELGMIRTLALGQRPAYVSKNLLKSSIESIFQGLKQLKSGLATKAGDARQIGGEFLFEPLSLQSPIGTPWSEMEKRNNFESTLAGRVAGQEGSNGHEQGQQQSEEQQQRLRTSQTSIDGKFEDGEQGNKGEEKRVTWCHRMKTTRDHAEIPELMEVLGLDGQGMPIKDTKRWSRALEQRKGTGLTMASQISAMKAEAGNL